MLFFVAAVVTMIMHGFARDATRIVPAQQVRQEHRRCGRCKSHITRR